MLHINNKIAIHEAQKRLHTEIRSKNIPTRYIKTCIGEHVFLNKDVTVISNGNGHIGDFTYINGGYIYDNVFIGKYCSMAYQVCIGPGEHFLNRLSTYPVCNRVLGIKSKDDFPQSAKTIIGNDVWIGNNVTVLAGVTVGDGAVLAAGAVVTKDVSPYAIVGGVPAKTLRFRFDDSTIRELQNLEWWNRDLNWIKEHKNQFCTEKFRLEDLMDARTIS